MPDNTPLALDIHRKVTLLERAEPGAIAAVPAKPELVPFGLDREQELAEAELRREQE